MNMETLNLAIGCRLGFFWAFLVDGAPTRIVHSVPCRDRSLEHASSRPFKGLTAIEDSRSAKLRKNPETSGALLGTTSFGAQ